MRRSEINHLIRGALAFFDRHRFHLPPFAQWTPDEWLTRCSDVCPIVERGLGWDVTDFGRGDFDAYGLLLFTLRNGVPRGEASGLGTPYAEKVMLVGVGQRTLMHHHRSKTEDIIVRAGGRLMIEVFGVGSEDSLSPDDVCLTTDGLVRTVPAGHVIELRPGESITLTPDVFHAFWAEGDPVLAGEVSTVNDDETDNVFQEPAARFPPIEEDEPPSRLLVSDYASFFGDAA
jgi:D-lyxose ketol-isomerase